MISEVGCFDTEYPLKIYAVCVCEILKKQADAVSEQVHAIYRTLLALLVIGYERQRERVDNKGSQELSEQDDEDYQVALGFVEHPLKNIDEYDYFKRTQMWLRQNKPIIHQQLVDRLMTNDREFLKRLMGIERVGECARQIVKIGRR